MELQKHTCQLDNVKGKLEFEYLPFVNYVLNINDVPVFDKFTLKNESEDEWHDVEVSVTGSLLLDSNIRIDSIAGYQTIDLTKELEIVVNPLKLVELTEGEGIFYSVKVTIDGNEAFCKDFPLLMQAYDQWIGSIIRPDLLAAFVTPNHPLIAKVVGNARSILKRLTGDDAFNAYQSGDANRVRCQVAAIYEALRAEGLSYVTAPASFEVVGQRIRLVDKVLEEKLGTCIDLSLLYASCLEAIGLNPLLVLTKGHCFVGCWLVRDSYHQPVGDDANFLLKGISDGLSEIVVMEATCLTSSESISFEVACSKGAQHLNVESEFECFIDVYQTRINNVRPIPLRMRQDDGSWQIVNEAAEHDANAGKVKMLDRYDLSAYDSGSAEVTKYTIWERKLLDFTLRNTLLNIRLGRRIIPLLSFAIDRLEDFLQDGKSFNVRPFPLNESPIPGERGIYESSNYASVEQHVLDEMKQHRLFSFLDEQALSNSLKYVYRASRTSMEENGANNLYLALGLLKWYETEQSKDAHFAPLLLLPIEIVRALGGGGYTIRARDEEVSLNITLTELLRQQHDIDMSVLSELPKDEHGVDVKKILAIVRDKIRNKKGWNVLDESLIGIFSFNKFVMWNDIHTNSSKLHEHEIISSLVEGKLNMSASALAPIDVKTVDAEKKPSDFAIPIDVDSSQLEAIIASGEGKSFILHGPPGTGKSQTITNIIANALYQGKRVLFVAEKMAALEVVQDRLSKIGLAPFCLELHSNKATKQHFLHQMDEALNVVRGSQAPDYIAQSDKVFEKRQEILRYVETLHKKDESGFSLYDCIEGYFAVEDCDDPVIFGECSKLDEFTPQMLDKAIEMLREMAPVMKIVGNPLKHPLESLHVVGDWTEAERQIRLHVPETAKWTARFAELNKQFKEIWGFSAPKFNDSQDGLKAFNALLNAPLLSGGLMQLALSPERFAPLLSAISAGKTSAELRSHISHAYSEAYLDIDVNSLSDEWNAVQSKWFWPRYFARKKFMRRLPASHTSISFVDVPEVLNEVKMASDSYQEFNSQMPELIALFCENAKNDAKWQLMQRSLELAQTLANMANGLDVENASSVLTGLNKQAILKAVAINEKILEANEKINFHFAKYWDYLTGYSGDLGELSHCWATNLPLLKDWILFRQHSLALAEFVGDDCLDQLAHENPTDFTIAALKSGFFKAKAQKMIAENSMLNFFNGVVFDETIARYREFTSQLQQLSKQAVYYRLASNLPSMSMAALDSSELGILKRNIKSGGRGRSIRSIIDLVPTLLPKLCPCMLMSPISVAQYISLDTPKFDIVIFDEASQMPTSEAVGAIARGKSVIVVGDPKQMPPTSFFATSSVGEDEASIDDMESILDDCIAMSIPSKYLTWHYRSKHESLITFSNRQYYDGRLTTFPSVDNMNSKVTLRQINGVYDRSRTRSNRAEAEAVVTEVMRRLSDPELSRRSIGIVAFSKVQQDKIEDLLTAELARHPDIEAIAFNSAEPIFVKNLENVQGDERDVILFSVGYGPDKTGNVSMNFGPLNIAGGERRLNVAVSRARYEMVVFSSLRPEQVDLRRTNALGVAGLKHFLEYAASGSISDAESSANYATTPDSVLAKLQKVVMEAGYEFDTNIGNSNFKVDIAIKDPESPNKYILGLLLDGHAYYQTKTIRDREIVQPGVLKLLNWNIHKVWTLDLLERPHSVREALTSKMQDLIAKKHQTPSTEEISQVKESESAKPIADASPADHGLADNTQSVPYHQADIAQVATLENADQLYSCLPELREILTKLIQTEAPITSSLLYKRVVKGFGLNRASSKVQTIVNDVLHRLPVFSQTNGNQRVYWAQESDVAGYDKYRSDSGRDITDVPYIEIENAMLYVLRQQIALDADDLKRLTANQLGYTRKGANIEAVTTSVLNSLHKQNKLRVESQKVMQI